jgi:DNA-binding transcriptional LysR family regulator
VAFTYQAPRRDAVQLTMLMKHPSSLELSRIRAFVAVAQELHFGRAAQRLGLSQPFLSRQIQALEADLSTPLFERSSRRVRLRPAGQALLPEALRLLEQENRALRAIEDQQVGPKRLRVGFALGTVGLGFSDTVRRFRERQPEVSVTPIEGCSITQERGLLERKIDVGFLYLPVYDSRVQTHVISHDPLVVYLPSGHPLETRLSLIWADLALEPWVLFSQPYAPALHDQLLGRCRMVGFSPQVVQEEDAPLVLLALVAARLGVTVSLASLAVSRPAGVSMVPLEEAPALELALAWRRDETAEQVRSFVEVALEHSTTRPFGPPTP